MPVAAHTRPGRRIAMAWSDRLAADLGSQVRPMLPHILAWAWTTPTFALLETVRRLHARGRALSARASDSNGVV